MDMAPEQMQRALKLAQAMGQGDDTMLIHVEPWEAELLHQITDGGSINPHTGLPAFDDGWSGWGGDGEGGAGDADWGDGDGDGDGGAGNDGGASMDGMGNNAYNDGWAGYNGGSNTGQGFAGDWGFSSPGGNNFGGGFDTNAGYGGSGFTGEDGLWADVKDWFGAKMDRFVADPVSGIANLAFGLVAPQIGLPVTGMVNSVSNFFDGPSVGGALSGALGAAPGAPSQAVADTSQSLAQAPGNPMDAYNGANLPLVQAMMGGANG